MPSNAGIEERLSALEAAIAELRDHGVIQPPAPDWLEQVVGSFVLPQRLVDAISSDELCDACKLQTPTFRVGL
jgi:hypothetical protein